MGYAVRLIDGGDSKDDSVSRFSPDDDAASSHLLRAHSIPRLPTMSGLSELVLFCLEPVLTLLRPENELLTKCGGVHPLEHRHGVVGGAIERCLFGQVGVVDS